MKLRSADFGLRNSLLAACALLLISYPVQAQEWYIPKQTQVLKRGTGEVGARFQFSSDRDGVEWDRTVEGVLTFRYTPFNRWEIYVEQPYIYREHEQVQAFKLENSALDGIGDVFTQISYDLAGGPDWKVIFSTDVSWPVARNVYEHRRDLGSGFYAVAPGLTYIKVVDPASIFFYLGYQRTFAEEFAGIGKVAPGDDFRFRFGASLMLSPRLRASFYTAGDVIGHTRLNNVQLHQTDGDVIRFGGGLSWNISDHYKLDLNSAFGATYQAPDATMSLGLTRSF